MTPQEQVRVLLAMVLCGAGLGACYDALWLLRRTLLAGRVLAGAADLLFGVLCAAGMTAAALALRVEALRWYTFAGALLGMGLWRASAGAALRRMAALCRGALRGFAMRMAREETRSSTENVNENVKKMPKKDGK